MRFAKNCTWAPAARPACRLNFKLRKGDEGWSIVETQGGLDEIIAI